MSTRFVRRSHAKLFERICGDDLDPDTRARVIARLRRELTAEQP